MPKLTLFLSIFFVLQTFTGSAKNQHSFFSVRPALYQKQILPTTNAQVSLAPNDKVFYATGKPTDDSIQLQKVRRRSKWSKWLGIGSLVSLLTPIGILALPAAIVAVVMGKHVKIDTNDPSSLKNASTGVITGWITLGLIALAVILTVVLLAVFLSNWQ